MKPKPPTRNTKCITCNIKLGTKKAINCQLCIEWVCLPCTGVSEELLDFCEEHSEPMSFLCRDCKLELPSLRELKQIKERQQQIDEDLASIQADITATDKKVKGVDETQKIQGQEITRHEEDIKGILSRLKDLETTIGNAEEQTETGGGTWATIAGRNTSKGQIQTIVRSEMNERAEIEKIKQNLVISGMAETESAEADKAAVVTLIEEQLDITADISKTERIGKPRIQKEGEDPPAPRLMKLFFVTQRSRKEVLSKVTNLRNSTDEHIKKLVYIRPDLTEAQIKQSKNLRNQLNTTRRNNPGKLFKIYRNQIVELPTPIPAEETADPQPPVAAEQEAAADVRPNPGE